MVFLFVKKRKVKRKRDFFFLIKEEGWAWWCTPVILALGRLRQEDCSEFQVKPGLQSETLPQEKGRGGDQNRNKKNTIEEVTIGHAL